MSHNQVALVGVDWGSTHLRACLLSAQGEILDERRSDDGALRTEKGAFGPALEGLLKEWAPADCPRLLAGMVGSSRGWVEAPYLECPADAAGLARRLVEVAEHTLIVPGVTGSAASGTPDIMRGEETQLVGAMLLDEAVRDGVVCLPGTHSKWVQIREGQIREFSTALSGESYALFSQHSILAPTVDERGGGQGLGLPFDRGVEHSGKPGGMLHHLFSARALMLRGALASADVLEFLSGLLIGHELRALAPSQRVCLIGERELCQRYSRALGLLDREAVHVDGLAASARGLATIAQHAGLL